MERLLGKHTVQTQSLNQWQIDMSNLDADNKAIAEDGLNVKTDETKAICYIKEKEKMVMK